jgi:hypothetical protein
MCRADLGIDAVCGFVTSTRGCKRSISAYQAYRLPRGNSTTYSDWQLSGGVLMPQHMVVSEKDKLDSDYRIAAPPELQPASASTFPPLKQDNSDVIMSAPSVNLPFTMEADHIILQAQVNGHEPIGFLVDTGDGHETINVARASVFGLSNYGSTARF